MKTNLFRRVQLPESVAGCLYLHSMPGRVESLDTFIDEIQRLGIQHVVCLTGLVEIEQKSPEYARLIKSGNATWKHAIFPISDYGIPDDRQAFMDFTRGAARLLAAGESILIHCGAGIGRTGMAAEATLLALGMPVDTVMQAVRAAGSGPETLEQAEVVRWISKNPIS